jgi:hypothetical protein
MINRDSLKVLANLGQLKHLDMSWIRTVENHWLDTIADSCPGLEDFSVCGCRQVTDIQCLVKLTSIQVLDLGFTKVHSIEVAEYMPQLRKLIMTETNVEDISMLQHCRLLEEVDLKATPVEDLSALSDAAGLTILSLSHCNGLCAETLGTLEKLPQLTVLDLSHIDQLDDDWLKMIAKSAPGLTDLNLRFTQVDNITPLADLLALAELNLASTKTQTKLKDALQKALPSLNIIGG